MRPALLALAPCGADMAGIQRLRSVPSFAVHGLHVLAKAGLRIPDLKCPDLRVTEHDAGENDGPFPATAMAAVSRPTRMPGPDDSQQVDSVLDEIHQQPLFLLGRKIAHKHQAGDAYRPGHLAPVVRHVLGGYIEVERAGVDPRPLEAVGPFLGIGLAHPARFAGWTFRRWKPGQQVPPQIPGQINPLLPITIRGPKGVGSYRLAQAGEHRCAAHRAVRTIGGTQRSRQLAASSPR